MLNLNIIDIENELKLGGEWLGTSRRWLQNNVKNGDTLQWSSDKEVSIPFYKLEDFAKKVAVAALGRT